jgi:hypothetical protein
MIPSTQFLHLADLLAWKFFFAIFSFVRHRRTGKNCAHLEIQKLLKFWDTLVWIDVDPFRTKVKRKYMTNLIILPICNYAIFLFEKLRCRQILMYYSPHNGRLMIIYCIWRSKKVQEKILLRVWKPSVLPTVYWSFCQFFLKLFFLEQKRNP